MNTEIICLIRLTLSVVLGFCIGFERKMRSKEAGIRTHTIVCLSACLFTVISIFGFEGADKARVAAQIVPGIGFIGAGIIFYHKKTIRGLTTAAGIWATAAIGMSVGTGMYLIAVCASAIIILIQWVLHLNVKAFHTKHLIRLVVTFKSNGGTEREEIKSLFGINRFNKISAERNGEELAYKALISTDKEITDTEIYNAINEKPFITSISREDDEF